VESSEPREMHAQLESKKSARKENEKKLRRKSVMRITAQINELYANIERGVIHLVQPGAS